MTVFVDRIKPMKPNESGIYHAVRLGMWIDEETGAPVWAVDIALLPSIVGPGAVVGNAPTLQAALDAAAANLIALYAEGD